MTLGLVGKKCGMTRVFTEAGDSIPVTVVEVLPHRVAQIKTAEKDGYQAVQFAVGTKASAKVAKPLAGHYAKANIEAGESLSEFRLSEEELQLVQSNNGLGVDYFSVGQPVDVQSVSKGKGYAGAVKRHNFRMQDATHGNSVSHRALGSTGQCQFPGRVFKGKKMAGQMGNEIVTVQNQEIVKVDADNHVLLIKGGIPGAPGARVIIKPAVKKHFVKPEAPKEKEGSE